MEEVMATRAPVEALVFRYSAAVAGSLYAWCLALLATALRPWRARSSGTAAVAAGSSDPAALPPASTPVDDASSYPTMKTNAPICLLESSDQNCGGTPKGRFRAYFNVDGIIIGEEEDTEEADGERDMGGDMEKAALSGSGREWRWEEVMEESRAGDLGWYSYQYRTALNGSVVRLWDGERRSPAASSRKRVSGRLAVEC